MEIKWTLLSLFLKVLSGSSKEVNGKEIDSEVVYSKDAGSKKTVSEKVYRFSADFALYIFWLFIKSCKKCFDIYFLKSY